MKIDFNLPCWITERFERGAAESLYNDRIDPLTTNEKERAEAWTKAKQDIGDAYPLFRAMLVGLTAHMEDR